MKPRSLTPLCSIPRSSRRSTVWAKVACESANARWCTEPGSLGGGSLRGSRPSSVKTVIRRPSPGSKERRLSASLSRFGCSKTNGIPSTPSQKSIDVCRSAPTSVMWCTPWLWIFRTTGESTAKARCKRPSPFVPFREMGERVTRGGPALLVAATAGVLLVLPASGAGTAPTERVSVATGGAQANGNSVAPAISKDGRYVAFYSTATNLVGADTNRARDVFVHDRQTGATTRVSVANDGSQANGESFAPAISGDGRYVAFSSSASNLVAGDQNGADDIFVRDRVANTTTRVSIGLGGAEPNAGSFAPAISADGNVVAYESDAANLVSGDTNGVRDVFVFDRTNGSTARVRVGTAGDEGDAPSGQAALDADGGIVAYSSFADNLITLDENFTADVFVFERATHTTTRVSVYTGDFEADGNSS